MGKVIEISSVSKYFDEKCVLDQFSLSVHKGEFIVILGPSGCGKSTLLRIICGLEVPDSGIIKIDGENISSLEPKDRNIALVFQNYALYPHKTVYQNLSLSLQLQKVDKTIIEKKVKKVSEKLGIDKLLARKPGSLSGGEMQRVAVGRALIKNPVLFLLDEPLSNLDANLRVKLREELRILHKELKSTMIYVTHDQIEAMSLGDKIVIINDGIIQQIGTPQEIFNKPKNIFVAEFIGYPKMNILKAKNSNGHLKLGRFEIPFKSGFDLPEEDYKIGIRPSDVTLSDKGTKIKVESYDYQGSSWIINADLEGQKFCIEVKNLPLVKDTISITLPLDKILFFNKESGCLIT